MPPSEYGAMKSLFAPVNGPAAFITMKSPVGNGDLDQDYMKHRDADAIEALYPGSKR